MQGDGNQSGISRRRALQSAGAVVVGGGAAAAAYRLLHTESSPLSETIAFHGSHQAGIATPQQAYLHFASFVFGGSRAGDLRDLLAAWSQTAATLTAGRPVRTHRVLLGPGPNDTGETLGLRPAGLTITIGLGRTLFEQHGRDRLGLRRQMPAELAPLPPFAGEQLDPRLCGGDLCVQACANDPLVSFHAVHALARIASAGGTRLLWNELGFLRASGDGAAGTPRNLIGFKDGTNNIRGNDVEAMDQHVWVAAGDGPAWMTGGTYLVARRIRIWFDTWDAISLRDQELVIGRRKASGAPLGAHNEHDPVDLSARIGGSPVIPANAHIRLASASANDGHRILRRGYSFADAIDPTDGQLAGGLLFISFQRSVHRQFVPIQRRLATSDALNVHTEHTASSVFACPPGAQATGFVGDGLFGA